MRLVALLASLLTASASFAQAVAYRAGPGIQMTTGASLPTTIAGRRTLWVDSSNRLRFWNGTDSTYPSTIAATTKGDLSVFTGSEWGRLAAGTNNYCLVADSAEVTGLKWASCSAATGYQTIKDEGSSLTQRTILNFTGAGVSCVDNAGATRTDCTISSGGSTGNWTFTGDAADDTGAAVLTIGATTATGVTLSRTAGTITMAGDTVFGANKGVTVTAGTSSFNFSGGTGTFLTSSGANTLSGTTTLAANKNFSYAAGTGTFDGSASSGAFTTSTGTNTLSGNVVISGAKTFTTGTGQASINGDLQMASGKHIYGGASTSAADFSAGSGIFKTTTGASSYLGSSNVFTASINPLTDSAEDIGDGATTKFWRVGYINDIAFKSSTGPFTIGSYGAANPYLSLGDTSCSTGAWSGACNRIRGLSAQTTLDVAPAVVTGLTASTEYVDVLFNFSRGASDTQHATGDYANQRAFLVNTPRYSFVGSSTITDAATMAIEGAPVASTNALITSSHALWVMDGSGTFENNNTGTTVGTKGVWLRNRVDASAAGAVNQKHSPAIVWSGSGWKTNATAGPQPVAYAAQLVPIEGTANPDAALIFYKSINGGAYSQAEINGNGYFGSNDAQALGTATTTSTTFVDVGNGSSTGFASWTAPTTKVTKTYTMRITVRSYMPTLGSSVTTYFQVLQDGVAIASQPTAAASQSFGTTISYLQTTWSIAVPCTAGSAHVYKLQWKVGGTDTAGVTATVGTLQYYITG